MSPTHSSGEHIHTHTHKHMHMHMHIHIHIHTYTLTQQYSGEHTIDQAAMKQICVL